MGRREETIDKERKGEGGREGEMSRGEGGRDGGGRR